MIATLADCGCGFEAASWGEIELLLACGISPARIIYGTSIKPEAQVRRAAAAGIDRFAADCAEELSMIAQAAPGARIFVRMAADDSSAVFQLNRKFGALPAHVPSLLLMAADFGLVPWGISFNVGSQVRDPPGRFSAS